MIRLVLDTATGVATAVLTRDVEVMGAVSTKGDVLSLLHVNIEQLVGNCALRFDEIEELAVVVGPGSWTGLHAGVTSAKTICQFLSIPMVTISYLEALAYTQIGAGFRVLSLLDAKRDSVYAGAYELAGNSVGSVLPDRKCGVAEAVNLSWDGATPLILVGSRETQDAAALTLPEGFARPTNVTYPSPEAFALLAHSRSSSRISGDARFGVVPEYMQDDFTIFPSNARLR